MRWRVDNIDGHRIIVYGTPYQYYQLQKIQGVHTKLFDDNEEVDKVLIKKDKKVKRDLRKESVDQKNVIEYGKNLVNKRVKGGIIFKYDRNGPFHWWVRFDDPNRDDEAMNLNEIKAMMI